MLFAHPDGDWIEWIKNTYRVIMNVAVVGSVLSYIEGTMPESVFSNAFQLLSIISMVPLILGALFGPLLAVFGQIKSCIDCVTSATGGPPAATGLVSHRDCLPCCHRG